jgi:hypothetical protein
LDLPLLLSFFFFLLKKKARGQITNNSGLAGWLPRPACVVA